MWGRKKNTNNIDTIISQGAQLDGDLTVSSNLFIDGTINGCIRSSDNNKVNVVSVGQNGDVTGDIFAPYIIIFGKITGDVYAAEKVELKPGAHITGNLYYKVIEMNAGAEVNGSMNALGETAQLKPKKVEDSEDSDYNVAKASGIQTDCSKDKSAK